MNTELMIPEIEAFHRKAAGSKGIEQRCQKGDAALRYFDKSKQTIHDCFLPLKKMDLGGNSGYLATGGYPSRPKRHIAQHMAPA